MPTVATGVEARVTGSPGVIQVQTDEILWKRLSEDFNSHAGNVIGFVGPNLITVGNYGTFESNVTGVVALANATLTRDIGIVRRGTGSLKVSTTNTGTIDGAQFNACATVAGEVYRATAWIWAPNGTSVTFRVLGTSNAQRASGIVYGTANWQEISVTWTAPVTENVTPYLNETTASPNLSFYADDVSLRRAVIEGFRHYDFRMMHMDDLTVPQTMADFQYKNVYAYGNVIETTLTQELTLPQNVTVNVNSTAGFLGGPKSITVYHPTNGNVASLTYNGASAQQFTGVSVNAGNTGLYPIGSKVRQGSQMLTLTNDRIVEGRSVAARTMQQVDEIPPDELTESSMLDLELYTLAAGNESWPLITEDSQVDVKKDTSLRYANTMTITVPTAGKTVTSTYRDNILIDFQEVGQTYYLEIPLIQFPAQASSPRIDLANSWIDISSSNSYQVSATDSFRFSDSLTSVSSGNNTFLRFNVSSIVNANRGAILKARLRLASIGGNSIIKLGTWRIYPVGWYNFPTVGLDTKRSQFRRQMTQTGGINTDTSSGVLLYQQTRPRNTRQAVKFNTGHHAIGDDNWFKVFLRYDDDTGDHIRAEFYSRNTQSRIRLYQRVAGADTEIFSTATNTNILTESTDYILVVEVNEGQTRASLYDAHGGFYSKTNQAVYTTGWQIVTHIKRGKVGFEFRPYNFDFTLDYFRNVGAEFVRFISKAFASVSPVQAATIVTRTSDPVDLAENQYIPSGDGTLTIANTFGDPPPSYKLTRDGTNYSGGLMTDDFVFIGDPNQLTIKGRIYIEGAVNGHFRVVLIDRNDSVGFIRRIEGLMPNQWNEFEVPVNNPYMSPAAYRVIVQQIGYYDDIFYLDDVILAHPTIAWAASPDNGTTWYNFLGAIDDRYSGVNFKMPGTAIKIKASALSDRAWVHGYDFLPKYALTGHVPEFDNVVTNGSLESGDFTGWTLGQIGPGITLTDSVNYHGRYALTYSASGNGTDYGQLLSSDYITIDPTKNYTLSAWFNRTAGTATTKSYLRLVLYDIGNNNLGFLLPNTAVTGMTLPTNAFAAPAGWTRFGGGYVGNIASNVAKVKVDIFPSFQATGAVTVAADAIMLYEGVGSAPYRV